MSFFGRLVGLGGCTLPPSPPVVIHPSAQGGRGARAKGAMCHSFLAYLALLRRHAILVRHLVPHSRGGAPAGTLLVHRLAQARVRGHLHQWPVRVVVHWHGQLPKRRVLVWGRRLRRAGRVPGPPRASPMSRVRGEGRGGDRAHGPPCLGGRVAGRVRDGGGLGRQRCPMGCLWSPPAAAPTPLPPSSAPH